VVLQDGVNDSAWLSAEEVRLIAFARDAGMRLVNSTDGGEGVIGYVLSPEARAKISAANKGHTWNKGKKRTQEMRAHMSKIRRGKPTKRKPGCASQYRGVRRNEKWWVAVCRQVYLGFFYEEEEAARAYDRYVREFLPHYPTNFPVADA
jgi:hypothetical protein